MDILIINSSVVLRRALKEAVSPIKGVKTVDIAANAAIGKARMAAHDYDLLIVDLNLPDTNGLELIDGLKRELPALRVVALVDQERQDQIVEAYRLGVWEVLVGPDPSSANLAQMVANFGHAFHPMITDLISYGALAAVKNQVKPTVTETQKLEKFTSKDLTKFRPSIIVIASSTGGPKALEQIFSRFIGPIKIPIMIAQHMPVKFTKILADSLEKISGVSTVEAEHHMKLEAGKIYVAPGGYHMRLRSVYGQHRIVLSQEDLVHSVKPAADPLFESVVEVFGSETMGVILTGMGFDGRDGAIAIKRASGGVIIQDQASCTVWGMPGSVFAVGAYDEMATLDEISKVLLNMAYSQ